MKIIWKPNAKFFIFIIILTIFGIFTLFGQLHLNIEEFDFSKQFSEKLIHKSNEYLEKLEITPDIYQLRLKRFLDYEISEPLRVGPGEFAKPVTLEGEEEELAKKELAEKAFYEIASEKISVNRALTDLRMPQCKSLVYPESLPTASVVIIYHNEAWSTLMRTVHSIVNRSPPRYLKEIILLDDTSYKDHLIDGKVDNYIEKTWPDRIVKVIHKTERLGLIRARIEGAKAATGDVLIFLDSHCEATAGWLEPLLARIQENRNVSLVPMIEIIDHATLKFVLFPGPPKHSGSFWWNMQYTLWYTPEHENRRRKFDTDPLRSPTMPGGLFAMNRDYFFELGSYDEGMKIWGGENIEISFRIWMCGGSLEIIPCSHVGHLYRPTHPYTFPNAMDGTRLDYLTINSIRVVQVWMDDYKRLFYLNRNDAKDMDYGDISERKRLREKLKCHDFQWYLDNIVPTKFIPDRNVTAYGYMSNPKTDLCFDIAGQNEFDRYELRALVYKCFNGESGHQILSLTKYTKEIRREWGCLTVKPNNEFVFFITCRGNGDSSQIWTHTPGGEIRNSLLNLCLDAKHLKFKDSLRISTCDGGPYQRWQFQFYPEN